jgi:hypothetical protein
VLSRSGIRIASAQNATTGTASLSGYPELTVRITDQGLELSPQSVPAGFVLLTVKNDSQRPNGAAVLGPGKGQTMADLQAAAATPGPSDQFPPFFYTATIPGGPGEVQPGSSAQAVVQLTAGDWVVITEGDEQPSFFSATEGSPVAQTEPAATLTVTEAEYSFQGFSDATIPAGQQIWKVTNAGAQPHMLVLGKVPADTTMDQINEVVSRPDNATPPAGGLTQQDFQTMGGVLLQSTGTTVWPVLDLPAGRYTALCFVTDPGTNTPHAMKGMVALFDVGSLATPAG